MVNSTFVLVMVMLKVIHLCHPTVINEGAKVSG